MRIQTNFNQQLSRKVFFDSNLPQSKSDYYQVSPVFKSETKQEPKYASSIALVTLASVASIFMFSRGFQVRIREVKGS